MTRLFGKEKNYVTREIAGETIIVPIRSHAKDLDAIYTLNEMGTLIWNLIDGHTSMGQIVNAVCEAYEVSKEEAEKDAAEFLESLHAALLIHPSQNEQPFGPKGSPPSLERGDRPKRLED